MLRYERRNAEAAVVLQSFWRNYLKRKWWKDFVRKSRAARRFQAMVRGALSRKLTRLWLARRWYLITTIQVKHPNRVTRLTQLSQQLLVPS